LKFIVFKLKLSRNKSRIWEVNLQHSKVKDGFLLVSCMMVRVLGGKWWLLCRYNSKCLISPLMITNCLNFLIFQKKYKKFCQDLWKTCMNTKLSVQFLRKIGTTYKMTHRRVENSKHGINGVSGQWRSLP